MDFRAFIGAYIDELNPVIESRNFMPFVAKWFTVPDCVFSFYDESSGLEKTKKLWKHLLPKGGDVVREVIQEPYKVDGGRVYTRRRLQGGNAPKPLWGLQETQFDDKTLISEIVIRSVQDEPKVEIDPKAPKARLSRIFLAFADAFNEFFNSGDMDLVIDWCAPNIRMVLDSKFWGMGVIGPHNRIAQTARFKLRSVTPKSEDTAEAEVDFTNWGGLDGMTPWRVVVDPKEQKIRELHLKLSI
jgi:hypothetical protein